MHSILTGHSKVVNRHARKVRVDLAPVFPPPEDIGHSLGQGIEIVLQLVVADVFVLLCHVDVQYLEDVLRRGGPVVC